MLGSNGAENRFKQTSSNLLVRSPPVCQSKTLRNADGKENSVGEDGRMVLTGDIESVAAERRSNYSRANRSAT